MRPRGRPLYENYTIWFETFTGSPQNNVLQWLASTFLSQGPTDQLFLFPLILFYCCNYYLSYLTYLFTYLLTYSMGQRPSWEANRLSSQETRRFIITFTSACHLSLFWTRSIQSLPQHPTSWRSILILFSHLCLGITSGLFPWGFPTTKVIYISKLLLW